jgi:hypothetical protein
MTCQHGVWGREDLAVADECSSPTGLGNSMY